MLPSSVPDELSEMVASAGSNRNFPATLIYNEGWLLRLLLFCSAGGANCMPFKWLPGSDWFSEALLPSPFKAASKSDRLSESRTHADGVVGNFEIGSGTKAGLRLLPSAKQFIVVEAKLFSPLSPGTSNAKTYNQAARSPKSKSSSGLLPPLIILTKSSLISHPTTLKPFSAKNTAVGRPT